MPIYEYKCDNGHIFETMQKMSEDALTECEVCGAPVVRLLHPPAVHFKGSGFYNTDYGTKRRAREKAAADAASKSESSKASSDSSSSDAKPASSDSSKSSSDSAKPASDAKPAKSDSKAPKPAASKS